jgi:hypothetical protein
VTRPERPREPVRHDREVLDSGGDPFRIADLDPAWIRQLEQVDVDQSRLSTTEDWDLSLGMLGLESEDRDLVRSTFPDAHADPDRWWLLERVHAVLADGMPSGDPAFALRRLDHVGVLGVLFPLHALVTVVPDLVRFHEDRGVPAEVTGATLNIGSAITHDGRGLPLVDTSGWFVWLFRGLLYQVGVLRAIPVRLGEAPDSEAYYDAADVHPRAPGHHRGDPAVSIHIPPDTRLTAQGVRSALEAMASVFAHWFAPDAAPRIGTCGSWLLDPQLRDYLPPESNIAQFQKLFTLFDKGQESTSIMQFVFPDDAESRIDELPTETTLQRAVIRHLKSGRQWRSCGGWTPLPPR